VIETGKAKFRSEKTAQNKASGHTGQRQPPADMDRPGRQGGRGPGKHSGPQDQDIAGIPCVETGFRQVIQEVHVNPSPPEKGFPERPRDFPDFHLSGFEIDKGCITPKRHRNHPDLREEVLLS
jgi:hypothetical protein